MSNRRTVRGSVFLSISLLLTSVLLVFSLLVYDYTSSVARERFAGAMKTLSQSVLSNLDARVADMDRVSLTLVYSQLFQNVFARQLAQPRDPASNTERIARLGNTEALIEITETILGPNQTVPQVNIYDLHGQMIGAGYYSRLIEKDVMEESWYPDVRASNGERIIIPPHTDALLDDTSVIVKGRQYVSLVRSFWDPWLSTEGIIEVKQYCEDLFSDLEMLTRSSVSSFVFDTDNNLLYPYDGPVPELNSLQKIIERTGEQAIATGVLPGVRQEQIFASAVSAETGWTLLIAEPAAGLAASVFQYATRIALVTVLAIAGSLLASYLIARRVTIPLKALHLEIESLDIGNLDQTTDRSIRPDLGEIDELRMAFRDMRFKLNESIGEVVYLRAHEKEAQLVALQAQLNPHFLYNSLQTIAVMAEEDSPAAIHDLIQNLTTILRYACSTESTTATLGTEMKYVESYLAAMQARFGESLTYVIDMPESIESVIVPRLILQPFIENCFKYTTSTRPPWRIELRGKHVRDDWMIEILDNGPGFDEATLARLSEAITANRSRDNGRAPMSISGMGICNSCERLKLAFGPGAWFEISNRDEGGVRIAMGVTNVG